MGSTLPLVVTTLAILSSCLSLNEATSKVGQQQQQQFNSKAASLRNNTKPKQSQQLQQCNIYQGHWVWDDSYPLYDASSCHITRKEFDCLKYGRKDKLYLKYRWQPDQCDIPRFDGKDFLRRMRGKKIMYIGDSISLNHWLSMVCLLHAAVPNSNITMQSSGAITSWTFQDYEVSVMFYTALYLVDIETEKIGRVLKLNSLKAGKVWKDMDVLVFNSWLWWYRRDSGQPWDFVQDGSQILKDMDRMAAFKKGLTTWATWVDSEIDPKKTQVFFQGVSPSHYDGKQWNNPQAKSCSNETRPMMGSTYPGGDPPALSVQKQVLSTISKPVHLLDITRLSQLRKDAHPSSHNGLGGSDCTHWCLAGLPDTWNQLLYTALFR